MALGFYFDMTSCTGCRTCQIACKDKNDLPIGTWYRHEETYETGVYPAPGVFHLSVTCNHCENPACVAICANGAIYKTEDGIVLIDSEYCDGCGMCVQACPYHVPQILTNGKAGKCDSCVAIRANGNAPQCVAACPMRALEFGELDALKAAHPDAVSISEVSVMPEGITAPTTLVSLKANAKENAIQVQL